jgi:hypothetical protein
VAVVYRWANCSACVSLDESLLAVAVDADEDGADEPGR